VEARTHDVPIHPDHGARVVVLLEHRDEHRNFYHGVEALLDPGSQRTLLPFEAVAKLGLEGTLRRGRSVRIASGGKVRTWRTEADVRAQIQTYIEGKEEEVGPKVALEPCFVKRRPRLFGTLSSAPPPLLGRADFLSFFDYSKSGSTFTLRWEE
jgi:hypothetical protein